MKRLLAGLVLALFLAAGASGCKCTAEKQAVAELKNTHKLVAVKFLEYLNADPKMSAKDKDDWKKLVESDSRNLDKLEKALEN